MQDVSGMFHKREIGVRNDTYTRAEIDAKDGAIQAAADKAQQTADSATEKNRTQDTQIAALQKTSHTHSNKDVLDKAEQPYTTAERDKLAGLENYTHPTHTAYSRGLYNITVDSEGHIISATAITKGDITSLGIPGANTTYTFHRDESLNWAESQCNKLQITKHESGVDTQLESIKLIPTVRVSDGFETSGIVYFLTVDSRYCKKDNRNETMWNGDTYDAKTWIRLNTKYSGPVGYKSSAALESEVAIVAPEFIGANATNQKQGLMSPEDKANVDANTAARHTHANKPILDQLNEEQWKFINGAANKAHVHENKGTLDKITDAGWNTVYGNTHSHENQAVLNAVTAAFTAALKAKLDGIAAGATKVAVDSALSATSTNPVQNKAVKAALDSKSASEHTHAMITNSSKLISGANNAAQWCRLGTLVSAGNFTTAVIRVWSGNGANGTASQNSSFEIHIKDSWQSTESATKACGVTVYRTNAYTVAVRVIPTAHNTYTVWAYLPWGYWNGNYAVNGRYQTWTSDFKNQPDRPEGTAADTAYYDNAFLTSTVAKATEATTLTDSGWIIPTFPSGIKSSTIRYRKQGKIVSVSGYVTFSEAASAKVVLTLPEGYRPPAKVKQFCAVDSSSQASFLTTIDTDGKVSFVGKTQGFFTTEIEYYMHCTFFVD